VLLVDDLLATGGTVEACRRLADGLGATIAGAACVIELTFLNARARLQPLKITSLLTYHTENPDE
jgi:adenine phosphoribosyltransferase